MTGDGFSGSDPAPIPDDDDGALGSEADVPLTEEFPAIPDDPGPDADMVLVEEDASCLNCAHFEVCAVFKGIAPLMEDWHTEEEDVPIDVEKLAWHCRKYTPTEE